MNNTRPLRILVFNWRDSAHPNAGGAEMYTQRVAMAWIEMGHSVTLFCASAPGHPSEEVVGGVRTIRRGSKHTVYREAKHFYRREGQGQYDLVVDEVNTRPFLAPKWVNDAPVIALIHQVCREVWFSEFHLPIAFIGRFILEPWWLRTYRNVQTVTLSQSSLESLKDYGLRNIVIVAAGMDPEDKLPEVKRETEPTVIFVGRLAANKRPSDALEAFRLVKESIPTAKMWVIGTGPLERKLHQSAPPGVEFLGHVSEREKRERLARANVLIVTSVREGWGLVVTEAAQCSTITVGYDVPGLRDSITASGGILVSPSPIELGRVLAPVLLQRDSQASFNVAPNGVSEWIDVAQQILNVSMFRKSDVVEDNGLDRNP